MLRSAFIEKKMDNARTFIYGMSVCHALILDENIDINPWDFYAKNGEKWAYSGQSSFFVDKNPVT